MDFVFLPYQAIGLVFTILCGLIGLFWFRNESKMYGFIFGVIIAVVGVGLFKLIVPVKLTTNTTQYNQQQNAVIMERHNQALPPRVTNERLSYEEELALKSKALRSRGEDK